MLFMGQPVCFFEAGIIAGCLENILNKEVKVTETKCHASGEDYCEFEVHDIPPSSDLN
uniref:V4R domain-containing protein n=1 Tax=Methanothermococcus thermolithotrophicus TaxID=2186 RepID=UPI002958BAAA|nr:V4R domain-containing protein [Methanothermococcus thermolithotrophicus]